MTHRFLVLGDNHGDTESLRRVLDDIEAESFDYAVHVGDFTSAWRTARQNDDEAMGKKRGVQQLREVESILKEFDSRARYGVVWVYGNQDYFGDLKHDLSVGTEIPGDDVITVGDVRFTNSLEHVDSDVVLVTHLEYWRLADHFDGLAHFCGNSHRGRQKGRRLNSAYLQFRDPEANRKHFGGYFLVDVNTSTGLDVEMRSIGELTRIECDRHAERGVQFQPESRGCMFCTEDGALMREMCASGFYGLTRVTEQDTVTDEALIEYAESLWTDPPEQFREEFKSYLDNLDEHRYAPLTRADDGTIKPAENSYSY